MRLLLVEDSPRLAELLGETVREAGWRLDVVTTIADATVTLTLREHDLVLLDLGLPDGNGLELLRQIRKTYKDLPVLVITARGSIEERIEGLDAGADDYLVKPFHHREFLARCRAMLRRSPTSLQPVLECGHLRYDPATAELSCDGSIVALPPRERALAELLMRDAGRVVQKRKLELALSEFGEEMTANALELAVSRLRKKLLPFETGADLVTVRGVGYMLQAAS
ncbi:two-component system response regulator [Rhizobium sp. Leaf371]|uniref:response regulator transcription factor n=1 Tax=unclassified Rhizobium TaxID=2613769 RepID=UPI000713406C|nr:MULTISPECIES: response regulator transcription factor [unclassified Rhizobium]KQS65070.1 two-component system response regulator [Rhizobium sp. Leaf371]TCM55947.1 DNA-binding response OmpR family regulator [Rhizobium sp. PP-F2F-G48]